MYRSGVSTEQNKASWYALSSAVAASLTHCLTAERLHPYLAAVGGDLDQAIALYAWNTQIGGAFFEDLGVMEVVLRNSMHEQLQAQQARSPRPGHWFDEATSPLDRHRLDDISKAKNQVAHDGHAITAGRVVAQLMLGFWKQLLAAKYQTLLWAPALKEAFPNLAVKDRRRVYEPVNRLHKLRNRIAHHEPIHDPTKTNLAGLHSDLVYVVSLINSDVAGWLLSNSRVGTVLASRPV